ncbi:MAG TPA: hypothetical protein VKB04_08800, partial [Anaerolineales bacterium]|nr:hypothetical protein [Anaerolineales bacterium]
NKSRCLFREQTCQTVHRASLFDDSLLVSTPALPLRFATRHRRPCGEQIVPTHTPGNTFGKQREVPQ